MCVSSYRLSEWTHMCSCCSWGQVPCHWLSDVRVSSSEPRPRPGPSPQLTLSEVELLVSTASHSHRGPLSSSAPASRRRATATGGQQLLFHNQSAAKKLFSFARFLLLLAPGWHTYCDINLDLVLLCGFRSFADTLKVLANNVHTQNVVRHVLVWFLAELCHF